MVQRVRHVAVGPCGGDDLDLPGGRKCLVEADEALVDHQARSCSPRRSRRTIRAAAVLPIELEQRCSAVALVEDLLRAPCRDRPAIARQMAGIARASVRSEALKEGAREIDRPGRAE